MRTILKEKLQHLTAKKYRISLAVLIPALFVLFAFGPAYIAVDTVTTLQHRAAELPGEPAEALQQALAVLRTVMWTSVAAALAAGILVAYSILAPIRKFLSGTAAAGRRGTAAEPNEDFDVFGRDFSAVMGSLGQYVDILESMSGGVIAFDREGRLTAMNPSAEHIFGCRAADLTGRSLDAFCRDVVRSPGLERLIDDGLRHGRQYDSEEIRMNGPAGRSVAMSLTTSILRDREGTTSGLVVTATDLSGAKQMHDELQKKLRLAGLGRLAAGVAHEVRNPLGAIRGMAQLIQEGLPDGDRRKAYGGVIEQETDRLNRVVENLLGLVRGPADPRPCDPGALLQQARELAIPALAGKQVEELDEREQVPAVSAEPEQLLQVFLNLFQNAFEAVPPGGRVRYKTASMPDRRTVLIEVGNTGPAMSSEVRSHLFEPFFTTKERGSGLGLAIVHQIVASHGGSIAVESDDRETVFRVTLPENEQGMAQRV